MVYPNYDFLLKDNSASIQKLRFLTGDFSNLLLLAALIRLEFKIYTAFES